MTKFSEVDQMKVNKLKLRECSHYSVINLTIPGEEGQGRSTRKTLF